MFSNLIIQANQGGKIHILKTLRIQLVILYLN
jgi:hypothetical protein